MSAALVLAACAVLAAAMGVAIQRGATCLVAMVDEWITHRRASRSAALLEASAWVVGGLVLLQALGAMPRLPAGHAVGAATVAGGALLGLGAWVNRACVFGAIARFASGDLAYLATPLGFYLGCLACERWARAVAPPSIESGVSLPVLAAALPALPFAVGVAWLLRAGLLLRRRAAGSPRAATLLIGQAFLALLLMAGPWAYTDVLSSWARGGMAEAGRDALLLVALWAGAAWGGRGVADRWRRRPAATALARTLGGGALMGWGSEWIPGGNDGLVLLGLPLGQPHAVIALSAMVGTIAIAMILSRRDESRA